MAGLAGEVEKEVVALNQIAHAVGIAHVCDVEFHLLADLGDVEQVAAVLGDQAVDKHDFRA